MHAGDVVGVQRLAVGDLDDVEQHVRRRQHRHLRRQLLRHTLADQIVLAALVGRQLAAAHQLRQLRDDGLDRVVEELHRGLAVERRAPVGHQPARGALDQGPHLHAHPGLDSGVELVVVGLQLLAHLEGVEDLAGHEVGPGQLGCRRTGLAREPRPVGHAGAVDQVVDHLGHDDLAAQRVGLDLRREALADLGREVGLQVQLEIGVVRQVGGQQLLGQHDLGERHQDRGLRRGQRLVALQPPAHLAARRQSLQLPVEYAVGLELLHPRLLHVEQRPLVLGGVGEREVLLVVVLEHQLRDLVGHLGEQACCAASR